MINIFFTNPLLFFIYLFALLIAVTVHEFSHAFMADYLGDPTPRLSGRLKLNPSVHLDFLGLMFLFFFGIGWGKPVAFDPFNLKNPRKDAALISIAGPLSNFILALILSLILKLLIFFKLNFLTTIGSFLLIPLLNINLILAVFNLLPVHPLDGFKIVGGILPQAKAKEWYELEKYGLIFLLMLIFPLGRSSMLEMIIKPVFNFLIHLLIPEKISGLIL